MKSNVILTLENLPLIAKCLNLRFKNQQVCQYDFKTALGYSRFDFERADSLTPYSEIAVALTCDRTALSQFTKKCPGDIFSEEDVIAKVGDTLIMDDNKIIIVRNPENLSYPYGMTGIDLVTEKTTSLKEAA